MAGVRSAICSRLLTGGRPLLRFDLVGDEGVLWGVLVVFDLDGELDGLFRGKRRLRDDNSLRVAASSSNS